MPFRLAEDQSDPVTAAERETCDRLLQLAGQIEAARLAGSGIARPPDAEPARRVDDARFDGAGIAAAVGLLLVGMAMGGMIALALRVWL